MSSSQEIYIFREDLISQIVFKIFARKSEDKNEAIVIK